MNPNPLLGVPLHWLGGFASGSFYVPFRGVRKWSWETYWLVGGIFSWLICPWIFALLLTHHLGAVLAAQSFSTLWWTYFFGVLWGLGGLTYGLTMRYLGLSLGTGIALGFCAAFGTLMPPLFKLIVPTIPVAESLVQIAATSSGQITLGGVGVCLFGIVIAALAGKAKEGEMTPAAKRAAVPEFNFRKGLFVGTFCGIMSACFAFGLTAGTPIADSSTAAGTSAIWSGLPKLVVVLLGGCTTNLIWCVILHRRNGSGGEYVGRCAEAAPLGRNYLFSALAGTTWYFQFFFYTMGETQMGRYSFASWTLHMASIIIFATMWGWILKEWSGSSRKAHRLIAGGVATLVLSTIVIGWGTYLKSRGAP
ncbi:MAG TPA: L-rhamnose/proton symporter RhaT [Opitutaceae bacterium]|jgi:L-rhamnose-H+ transport protein